MMQQPYQGKGYYGLGLYQKKKPDNDALFIGHNGVQHGLNSGMFFNPKDKSGMIVISTGAYNSEKQIVDNILHLISKYFFDTPQTVKKVSK